MSLTGSLSDLQISIPFFCAFCLRAGTRAGAPAGSGARGGARACLHACACACACACTRVCVGPGSGAGSGAGAAPAPRGPPMTALNNQRENGAQTCLERGGLSPRPLPKVSAPIPPR